MSGSNVTVNKVFGQFWSETTSQKKQLHEHSDSDSDIEEQKKRKKKRLRKKTQKRIKKSKPQSTFNVRHVIPTKSVTEQSNPEIQCVELNFSPNDDNKEELIASTQFFNSRNKNWCKSVEELKNSEIHFTNLVDLEKSCQNEYLEAKIGVHTAENEPSKVCST